MHTYESVEHESLRATVRCLTVNFGKAYAHQRVEEARRFWRVGRFSELSPFGANAVRKTLERALPIRGDFA
ncbi:hypothetical protein [Bradyrhizobium sp.]|jgi:hypothetical protein|uniref:hypothetical protein n=1 Tax=Bradyrhizobium sp. TaxID=376 RepID=UPI002DDD981C|nr:hypothetical protein [Bradyrhizobium sp.]HEV2155439.1 hypothetical protein [Bradyrhizobium sp.]